MISEPTVFVVDDHPQFLDFMSVLIRSMHLKVMSFSSAEAFLRQFDSNRTGFLIVDVNMPITSGLELQEALNREPLRPPMIVMTGGTDVPTAVRALKQGAVEFLHKPFNQTDLYEAIQRAIAKDTVNREKHARGMALSERFSKLTAAERDVLQLVLNGDPNKVVAANLNVSQRTVEDRRRKLMQKLEVKTLAELVRLAVEARNFSLGLDPLKQKSIEINQSRS